MPFRLAALLAALMISPAFAEDWPQFLGPKRDGVWREDGILEKFPTGGPKKLWSAKLGGGYAGPAVVVSSAACNQNFPDVVLMAITSQAQNDSGFHLPITGWKKAGLIGPSTIKPVLATFEKSLLLRRLGRLERPDRLALESLLRRVLSP